MKKISGMSQIKSFKRSNKYTSLGTLFGKRKGNCFRCKKEYDEDQLITLNKTDPTLGYIYICKECNK